MRRLSATFALWAALSSPAVAQNLLVNPGFDLADQLDGWICTTTDGTATWSSLDRQTSAVSGSMQHDVLALADNGKVRCSQCVAIDELWSYAMSAWYFWPSDPDVTQLGTTRLSFLFFAEPDCTSPSGNGPVDVGHPALDTWTELRSGEAEAPAGSVAAMVHVFTWQNFADQPVRARLDDLAFFATTLFRDGFENGDLTGWSSSTP